MVFGRFKCKSLWPAVVIWNVRDDRREVGALADFASLQRIGLNVAGSDHDGTLFILEVLGEGDSIAHVCV